MIKKFAESLKLGVFAERDTVQDAYNYAYEIAEASGNSAAVITAVHVVVNTIANKMLELADPCPRCRLDPSYSSCEDCRHNRDRPDNFSKGNKGNTPCQKNHKRGRVPENAVDVLCLRDGIWCQGKAGDECDAASFKLPLHNLRGGVVIDNMFPVAMASRCDCQASDCPRTMAMNKTNERFGCANGRLFLD